MKTNKYNSIGQARQVFLCLLRARAAQIPGSSWKSWLIAARARLTVQQNYFSDPAERQAVNSFLNLARGENAGQGSVLNSLAEDLRRLSPEQIIDLVRNFPMPCMPGQFVSCLLELPREKADRVAVLFELHGIGKETFNGVRLHNLPRTTADYLKGDTIWRRVLFDQMDNGAIDRLLHATPWQLVFKRANLFLGGWRPPSIRDLEIIKKRLSL